MIRYLLSLGLLIALFSLANIANDASAKPQEANQETVRSVVEKAFGSTVQPVTGFKPFFLTGDFNGDRAQDLVIVVRLNRGHGGLPRDVRIINPFGYGPTPYPLPALNATRLGLAIIHGSKGGWQTDPAAAKFVLLGDSPVLILQAQRATEPGAANDLMSLQKKRARRARADAWPPAAARGDGVVVETEATESILYWDGKTYRWKEAEGGE